MCMAPYSLVCPSAYFSEYANSRKNSGIVDAILNKCFGRVAFGSGSCIFRIQMHGSHFTPSKLFQEWKERALAINEFAVTAVLLQSFHVDAL